MGKPRAGAAYFRAWRAAHPEYRERENARCRQRRRATPPGARGDRSAEYAKRNAARRAPPAAEPLPQVHPHLRKPGRLSWWEEELALDLEQERALAALEGRDPAAAAAAYRTRETNWRAMAMPYLLEERPRAVS